MIDALVGGVLQRRPVSPAGQWAWAAFLLLCPLAFVGGSLLEHRATSRDAVKIMVDRDEARATAQQFAAGFGIDASTWTAYIAVDPNTNLLEYFRLNRDAAANRARSFSSPIRLQTLLASPGGEYAEVFLDQDGRVNGFDFQRFKALTGAAPLPVAQASAIALNSVKRIPNLASSLPLGEPHIDSLEKTGPGCRKFLWHAETEALPGLSYDISTGVCGASVVRQIVTATVSNTYAKAHWLRAARPVQLLEVIYGLYMTVLVLYSIYRYARRTLEREVSHARTLALALLIASAIMASFLCGLDEYVWGVVQGTRGIIWYPLFMVGFGFLILGLGVAVAYGAGEGDLREFYPGRMTSLDALFRGKLFSRNVGRSAVFGAAFAAWMLLLEGLADWAFHSHTGKFTGELLKFPLLRTPLLAVFSGQAMFVSVIPASGLLLPLGFLGRRVHRRRLRNVLMVLFAALGCLIGIVKFGEIVTALIAVSLLSAILLGAFFGMDLLASIFGLGAFLVATTISRFIALSPSWLQLGVTVGVIGLCFLAAEMWAALRGIEYLEDEVRPAYAGNMASRQQMQAELAAAREAQLHLLPKAAPEIHGLFITAACLPARTVGGDFYDFYPLGEGRLGIFIAEGGNRGIGSALNIALAKGFLMHTVQRNLSPREVIQRLESTLGPLLQGSGATTYVAYAVIDAAAATIRYARTGEYPRVLVGSSLVSEQSIRIPGSTIMLYEGAAPLRTGDTVLLFTDGIARRVRTTGPGAADNILKVLARHRRQHELDDDLTAVVVRVTRAGSAMEIVA